MDQTKTINLFEIDQYENCIIKIPGWVHGVRGSNQLQFIQLRNSGKIIQVVAEKKIIGDELFKLAKSLSQETSIIISGEVKQNQKASGGYEIFLNDLTIQGSSENYPITPKEHGPDFLHNNRHLWLRSKKQLSIIAIRNEMSFAIRKYFYEKHFTLIDTPILTGSIGESAGTLFATEYFDLGKAYLAQTGQLYLETGIFAHSNVYCFGPTFRAEKSKTKRHLTEFWMVEAEMAFAGNDGSIAIQEEFVKYIMRYTLDHSAEHLKILERDKSIIENYISQPFAKITYDDAIQILKEQNFAIEWGEDINAEGENILTDYLQNFVFIKNYPRKIKAFYMKQNPENPETVLCADLIAPDGTGEIIGGSEREEDYLKIMEKLKEENLPVEEYSWYLDLRKYGSVPHSGFGLGLERMISWFTGISHVRECIPYPRLIYRLNP